MRYPGEFPQLTDLRSTLQKIGFSNQIVYATNLILFISLMAIQHQQTPVRRIADVILREL